MSGPLTRVRWRDIDYATSPGDYEVDGNIVQVLPRHIEVWQAEPAALFHTFLLARLPHGRKYVLATYEVPGGRWVAY